MKFGVIVFPGSNCDRDVATVTRGVFGQPTRMVWHQETDLSDLDVVVLPGGFSYGDYLRCGALAQFAPVMRAVREFAQRGGYVLGVCNGFQILTEAGLLPGALVRNRGLHFVCEPVALRLERTDLPWTRQYAPEAVITLPIAHGEGCYYASPELLAELEAHRQIVFRYCTAAGEVSAASNPNGSLANIAGICNRSGNVLGLMPHPERAADPQLGNTDGAKLFASLLSAVPALVA